MGLRWRAVAATAVGITIVAGLTALPAPAQGASRLRDLADARRFFIGSGVRSNQLGNAAYASLARETFNSVTPEDEFKWDATEPGRGAFNFVAGDKVVDFAAASGQRVRGLTLVWHSQLPAWVQSVNASDLPQTVRNHVTGVVTHYRGRVAAWDVVSEPLTDTGARRATIFQQRIGDSWIEIALRAARAADPDTKLFISEYGAEGINAKSDALLALAKDLLTRGVPLDGIALQGHFATGGVPADLGPNLRRFTALGLNVELSEVEVSIPAPSDAAKLAAQARDYLTLVNTCLAVPRCTGLTTYALHDGDTFRLGETTLFDAKLQAKPAYSAVLSAFTACCTMPVTTTTTTTTTTSTTTTTTSARTTTSTTTTSTGGLTTTTTAAGCTARLAPVSGWGTGFVASVAVAAGPLALTGWRVTVGLPPGVRIVSLWNGRVDGSTGTVVVTNEASNGRVPAGGSTGFGFLAAGPGPQGITLACTPA